MILHPVVCAWCGADMGTKEFKVQPPDGRPTHGICPDCKKKMLDMTKRPPPGGRDEPRRNALRRRDRGSLERRAGRGDREAAVAWLMAAEDEAPGTVRRKILRTLEEEREAAVDEAGALLGAPDELLSDECWTKAQFGKAVAVGDELIVDGHGRPVVADAEKRMKPPEGWVERWTESAQGDREIEVESAAVIERAASILGLPEWAFVAAVENASEFGADWAAALGRDGRIDELFAGTLCGGIEVWEPGGIRRDRRGRRIKCDICGSDSDWLPEDGRGNVLCSCQACPDCGLADAYGMHEPGCPRVGGDDEA